MESCHFIGKLFHETSLFLNWSGKREYAVLIVLGEVPTWFQQNGRVMQLARASAAQPGLFYVESSYLLKELDLHDEVWQERLAIKEDAGVRFVQPIGDCHPPLTVEL